MAKKNKNMMFSTQKHSDDRNFKKFSVIFAACVLMILLVSCLVILNKYDFDIRTAMGGDSATTKQTDAVSTVQTVENADKTYFLWCADSQSKQLHFAWLVNFRMPEMAVSVCTLTSDTAITESGETLGEAFADYGANETVRMLGEFTGVPVDGYIGSDDGSFKAMINYFGGMEITVPEQIEYRSEDFTVILVKGRQRLMADSLFKYLRYLGTIGSRGESQQASALLEMLDKIFTPENAGKRERYFSKLSNTLDTDLSIVDYSTAEKGIEAFMQSGIKDKNIVDSLEEVTLSD